MSKLFFDHLVKLAKLEEKLAALEAADEEVDELRRIVDELVQQKVVEVILSVLHEDHHHTFISRLHLAPADPEILEWLREQVEDIDGQIEAAIGELEEEIIKEMAGDEG